MNQENFLTSDFCLAATLLTLKFKLIKLDRTDPKRISFVFEDRLRVVDIMGDYHSKVLQVSPIDFFNAQRELKTRMYSQEF